MTYPDELENREPIVAVQGMVLSDVTFDVGEIGTRFFAELRDNKKIYGIECRKCKRVYVPPRNSCKECFDKLVDWVEVGDEGTLITFTTVYAPVANQPKDPPFTLGIIQLDGADTGLVHLVEGRDPGRLQPGMRLRAVFREIREGNIRDIVHFIPT